MQGREVNVPSDLMYGPPGLEPAQMESANFVSELKESLTLAHGWPESVYKWHKRTCKVTMISG